MRRTAAALAGVTVVLAGCGGASSQGPKLPPLSDFAAGTCRVVAPDLLQIARDDRRLGKGGDIEAKVLGSLTRAQDGVRQIAAGAEPTYQPALNKLVVSVGLIRLQARVGSYKVAQGADLQRDDAAAIAVCTARSSH